jgi:hypothetical protein
VQLHTNCVKTEQLAAVQLAAPTFLWDRYDATIQRTLGVMKAADTKVVVQVERSGCSCDGSEDYSGEQFSPDFIALKIVACIVILLSIIEFGVGGAVSSTVVGVVISGAWWGGLISIIAGILALVAYNRAFIIAASVISPIAIIIAAIGAFYDGAARRVLSTTYSSLLSASAGINSIIAISTFVLSIISCVIACRPRKAYGSNETPFVGVAHGDP